MVTRDPAIGFLDPDDIRFRADRGLDGGWFVWRRIGPDGWVTMCECEDAGAAQAMAEKLNMNQPDEPEAARG